VLVLHAIFTLGRRKAASLRVYELCAGSGSSSTGVSGEREFFWAVGATRTSEFATSKTLIDGLWVPVAWIDPSSKRVVANAHGSARRRT
jgi:hypothetical protein